MGRADIPVCLLTNRVDLTILSGQVRHRIVPPTESESIGTGTPVRLPINREGQRECVSKDEG